MPKTLGIIPSRLESSRIYQKPLKKVHGIPLVLHVYERARLAKTLDKILVATDSVVIKDLVESNGGEAMLTSKDHLNGTERMGEVLEKHPDYDLYTLINGDEILLNPTSIDTSVELMVQNPGYDASLLAVPFERKNSGHDFKVVLNQKNELMYISRADIPSEARNSVGSRLKAYHLMTFHPETIHKYKQLDKTPLEKIEDHEHLRLLETGSRIICQVVDDECISLDSESDLERILHSLSQDTLFKEYASKIR
ncbi:hypothetical protein OAL42_00195 [Akkermansiaceae bacterium]|nr:hypothetical protein [Akkermansiaceae bacterium]